MKKKIIHTLLACVVLALQAVPSVADVLVDEDFSSPYDLRRFRVMRAGNYGTGPVFATQSLTFPMQEMRIDGTRKWPIFMYNGTDTGWNYISIDFNANELPESGTFRFTVWLKTNRPDRVRLIATEGARVGNGLIKKSVAKTREKNRRHAVSVELGRFNAGDGFSFGCGIDYGGGDTWVIVDRVRIEHISEIAAVGVERQVTVPDTGKDYTIPEIEGLYAFLNSVIDKTTGREPREPTPQPVAVDPLQKGILYSNDFGKPLDYLQLRQVSISRYPDGKYFPDWGNNLYINLDPVEIENRVTSPLLLYCGGTANFAVADFAPEAYPQTGQVCVRVSLKTNNPEDVQLVFSENEQFSGLAQKTAPILNTVDRQEAVACFERLDPSAPFAVGVGIKSGSRGTWIQVDRIVVEGKDQKATATSRRIADTQAPALGLDFQFLKSRLDTSVLTPWPSEYARLEEAGLAEMAYVKKKSQRMRELQRIQKEGLNLAADGEVSLANISDICSSVKDEQFSIRTGGADLPIGMQSTFVPGAKSDLKISTLQDGVAHKMLLLNNNSGSQFNLTMTAHGDIAALVKMYRLHWVYGAPDYPELLDQYQVIEIPSSKLAGVMLQFDTAGVKPGVYTGEIWVSPLDDKRSIRKLECSVKVIANEPEGEDYPHVMGYEANHNTKPGLLKLMVDQKIDTFHIFYTNENASPLKDFMDVVGDLGVRDKVKRLRIEAHFVPTQSGNVSRNQNSGWLPKHDAWLDGVVAQLTDYGFDYDDWILYTYDEVELPDFLRDLKRIRSHNENVRMFSNFATEDLSVYEEYEPYMDVWQPPTGLFLEQASARPNALEWYLQNGNKKGNELWTYYCDATPQDFISKYQIHGWINWRINAVGMAYYSCKPCRIRPEKGRYNFGMCYEIAPGEYIPSRRWMVWRQSIEDFRLLRVASRIDPERTRRLADDVVEAYSMQNTYRLSEAVEESRAKLLEIIEQTAR